MPLRTKLLVSVETPCKGHPPAWLPGPLQSLAERFIRRVWHRRYTALCMRDSMSRGEAPFASQAMYDRPDVLDDSLAERTLGMECGIAWTQRADIVAVYADHGVSSGMTEAIRVAKTRNIPVQVRYVLSPPGHFIDEVEVP